MQGKRFVSPSTSAPRERRLGPSASLAEPVGARSTPSRYTSATSPGAVSPYVSSSATRRRRNISPGQPRHRTTTSPEVAFAGGGPTYSPLSSSVGLSGRAVSTGNLQSMLSDLVQLSQSIAMYLEQDAGTITTTATTAVLPTQSGGASDRERATLSAREIERVVKRVQSHFKAKVELLEKENEALRRQLADARSRSGKEEAPFIQHENRSNGRQGGGGGGGGGGDRVSPSVRQGIGDQENALDELGRTWASSDGQSSPDVEQLRKILLAEKRQRLLVEEQTQSLTEQHAKVVWTLERRLKKQEDQLRDLISAVDRSYNGVPASGGPLPRFSTPSSPTALAPGASPGGGGQTTPRRLLRQQLAQHQQTQRALQQYRQHIAAEGHANEDAHSTQVEPADAGGRPHAGGETDDDYLDALGLGDVKATLQAIQRSTPPTAATTASSQHPNDVDRPGVRRAVDDHHSGTEPSPNRGSSVDDIGAYLDSITKELETLGADDDDLL